MLLLLAAAAAVFAVAVSAAGSDDLQLANVPSANTKATAYAPASRYSRGLIPVVVAQGAMKLENPQGIITNYGYENDVQSGGDATVPLMTPSGAAQTEAQKTEPDKNTYLVLENQTGADPNYDYGTHFLFQGHENGAPVTGGEAGASVTGGDGAGAFVTGGGLTAAWRRSPRQDPTVKPAAAMTTSRTGRSRRGTMG